ncbi:unnamed protein product [Soboliphyme baturini]|uniref:Nucleoprotein TPR n=1 Tax=Soboliphyme baturini TaxID=241478 RepID=A0A183IBP3_9BILA|nr:unnamed protein product [Soboliphyme baturini]
MVCAKLGIFINHVMTQPIEESSPRMHVDIEFSETQPVLSAEKSAGVEMKLSTTLGQMETYTSQVAVLEAASTDDQINSSVELKTLREAFSAQLKERDHQIVGLTKQITEKEHVVDQTRYKLELSMNEIKQLTEKLRLSEKALQDARDFEKAKFDSLTTTISDLQTRLVVAEHGSSLLEDMVKRLEAECSDLTNNLNKVSEENLKMSVEAVRQQGSFAAEKETWTIRESHLLKKSEKEERNIASMQIKNDRLYSDVHETLRDMNSLQKFLKDFASAGETHQTVDPKVFMSLHDKIHRSVTKIVDTLQTDHFKMHSDAFFQEMDVGILQKSQIARLQADIFILKRELNTVTSHLNARVEDAAKINADVQVQLAKVRKLELLEQQYKTLGDSKCELEKRLCAERRKVAELQQQLDSLAGESDRVASSKARYGELAPGDESVKTLPSSAKENKELRSLPVDLSAAEAVLKNIIDAADNAEKKIQPLNDNWIKIRQKVNDFQKKFQEQSETPQTSTKADEYLSGMRLKVQTLGRLAQDGLAPLTEAKTELEKIMNSLSDSMNSRVLTLVQRYTTLVEDVRNVNNQIHSILEDKAAFETQHRELKVSSVSNATPVQLVPAMPAATLATSVSRSLNLAQQPRRLISKRPLSRPPLTVVSVKPLSSAGTAQIHSDSSVPDQSGQTGLAIATSISMQATSSISSSSQQQPPSKLRRVVVISHTEAQDFVSGSCDDRSDDITSSETTTASNTRRKLRLRAVDAEDAKRRCLNSSEQVTTSGDQGTSASVIFRSGSGGEDHSSASQAVVNSSLDDNDSSGVMCTEEVFQRRDDTEPESTEQENCFQGSTMSQPKIVDAEAEIRRQMPVATGHNVQCSSERSIAKRSRPLIRRSNGSMAASVHLPKLISASVADSKPRITGSSSSDFGEHDGTEAASSSTAASDQPQPSRLSLECEEFEVITDTKQPIHGNEEGSEALPAKSSADQVRTIQDTMKPEPSTSQSKGLDSTNDTSDVGPSTSKPKAIRIKRPIVWSPPADSPTAASDITSFSGSWRRSGVRQPFRDFRRGNSINLRKRGSRRSGFRYF